MHGFYIEKRTLAADTNLSTDLAQHILLRGTKGMVVVVTDKPHDLGSITKKQWELLIRKVQRERASTLRAGRIAELSRQIDWMQRLNFSTKIRDDLPESSVIFATPPELAKLPPICSTLYITCGLDDRQLHFIASWLPKSCVIIRYDLN